MKRPIDSTLSDGVARAAAALTIRHPLPAIRFAAFAAISIVALAGCSGGGASTEDNPLTSNPNSGGNTYSGEPAQTEDIRAFQTTLWDYVRGQDRCGRCHNEGGQAPQFARSDNVNLAYEAANPLINRNSPSESLIVTKVGGGHNCWLADSASCASLLTDRISDWIGGTNTGGRQIELVAPPSKDPGSSRRFPALAPAEFTALHNVLDQFCSNCHQSDAATAQSPYFAADDVQEAYLASISKINLDDPEASRFVLRLGAESHNCWSNCQTNANTIRDLIATMATAIPETTIDPSLIVSKALTLYDGTIASGGSRVDANEIARYEFKTGQGSTAYDTSGVDPAADLQLSGGVTWVGGWGINVTTGKAQASTTTSRKLHDLITATGEYSIEAWVVPANVTQEDARIVSYSGSTTARNFTLGQTLYNYDFFGRSSVTGSNGTPQLSTADDDERLQASLQHVVMTFDPLNGRRIYVNGEFTGDMDAEGGGNLADWDNSFALVLGNEVSNNRQWQGVIRFVSIHNRALNGEQIAQNFEAGVGEKFFLLFGVEHITEVPQSYVMFQVAQYDSYAYLFTTPTFISLDGNARPGSIPVKGLRIGINGAEPLVGQAYRLLDTVVSDSTYSAATGQVLSNVGTIIGLENGPAFDEFFLCFDQLGSRSNVCSTAADGVPPLAVDLTKPSDIGVRTFDEINATMATLTGVSPNDPAVKAIFTNVRQSLPAVDSVEAFLSSHQTSIAQLAIQYCDALVDSSAAATYWPGLNLDGSPATVFANNAGKDLLINPLIERMIGTNLTTQPAANALKLDSNPDAGPTRDGLYTFIDTLNSCNGGCPASRTRLIAKATCGAVLGSGAVLIH
jgi:hypothetical protein